MKHSILAAVLLFAMPAFADEKAECAAASMRGQKLRDAGHYVDARREFLQCAKDACPAVIKKDCGDWLAALEQSTPSLVFTVRDGSRDVSEVRVLVDASPLVERLDGRPVLVDPGERLFRFELPDGRSVEQRMVVRTGEKNRPLVATIPSAKSAPGPEPVRAHGGAGTQRILAYVLGGVAVVSFGSFAILAVSGKSEVDRLRSTCAPYCAPGPLDAARTKLAVADVLLVTGIVALGAAAFFFVSSLSSPKPRAALTFTPVSF